MSIPNSKTSWVTGILKENPSLKINYDHKVSVIFL